MISEGVDERQAETLVRCAAEELNHRGPDEWKFSAAVSDEWGFGDVGYFVAQVRRVREPFRSVQLWLENQNAFWLVLREGKDFWNFAYTASFDSEQLVRIIVSFAAGQYNETTRWWSRLRTIETHVDRRKFVLQAHRPGHILRAEALKEKSG